MSWTSAYLLLAAICAIAYVIVFNIRLNARLGRFWDRPDALVEWQHKYPSRSVEDITAFLLALSDAFAFDRKHAFRFVPDDWLFDIYRAVQPGMTPSRTGWGDVHHLELLLRTGLGLSLQELWGCDRTLGTIFEHTRRSAVAPDAPR